MSQNKSRENLIPADAAWSLFHVFRSFCLIRLLKKTFPHCCAGAWRDVIRKTVLFRLSSASLTWLLPNLSKTRGSGSLIMPSAHIFFFCSAILSCTRRPVHLKKRMTWWILLAINVLHIPLKLTWRKITRINNERIKCLHIDYINIIYNCLISMKLWG